jgi:hypothetical protein
VHDTTDFLHTDDPLLFEVPDNAQQPQQHDQEPEAPKKRILRRVVIDDDSDDTSIEIQDIDVDEQDDKPMIDDFVEDIEIPIQQLAQPQNALRICVVRVPINVQSSLHIVDLDLTINPYEQLLRLRASETTNLATLHVPALFSGGGEDSSDGEAFTFAAEARSFCRMLARADVEYAMTTLHSLPSTDAHQSATPSPLEMQISFFTTPRWFASSLNDQHRADFTNLLGFMRQNTNSRFSPTFSSISPCTLPDLAAQSIWDCSLNLAGRSHLLHSSAINAAELLHAAADKSFKADKELEDVDLPGQLAARLVPTLRDYQADAVRWMLRREKKFTLDHASVKCSITCCIHHAALWDKFTITAPDSMSVVSAPTSSDQQSSESGVTLYRHRFSSQLSRNTPSCDCLDDNATLVPVPATICGGILADEMGLGKTVEVMSLVLAHPRPAIPNTSSTESNKLPKSNADHDVFEAHAHENKEACICGQTYTKCQWVQCDVCNAWMHTVCVGWKGPETAEFICVNCVNKTCKTTLVVCPTAIVEQVLCACYFPHFRIV